MRRCLETCDVPGIRTLWQSLAPHLPQPTDDAQVVATIHYARTLARSIRMRERAYSHRWLVDAGYPSGLPDHLRPRAERLYPRIVEGVGVAVQTRAPLALAIRDAVSNAVLECYADGKTEPTVVRARMHEARIKV